jgi:hypothetical protein
MTGVRSFEPSTTMTSHPGSAANASSTTLAMAPSSLRVIMTTATSL